jgi:hypothetical protein
MDDIVAGDKLAEVGTNVPTYTYLRQGGAGMPVLANDITGEVLSTYNRNSNYHFVEFIGDRVFYEIGVNNG